MPAAFDPDAVSSEDDSDSEEDVKPIVDTYAQLDSKKTGGSLSEKNVSQADDQESLNLSLMLQTSPQEMKQLNNVLVDGLNDSVLSLIPVIKNTETNNDAPLFENINPLSDEEEEEKEVNRFPQVSFY